MGQTRKALAGECDDAQRVAVQSIRKIVDRELGARQPVGLDVGVDMLREVSIANTISLPRRLICSQR
jgi:hypothetical protein